MKDGAGYRRFIVTSDRRLFFSIALLTDFPITLHFDGSKLLQPAIAHFLNLRSLILDQIVEAKVFPWRLRSH